MKTLSTEYRRQLERTVVEARDIAEAGAKVALEALAVQHHEPYGHMDGAQRTLRRRLRAHARQLGDRPDARSGGHGIDHLVHECAYEHWHGMLFARFLAENNLLIEPEMGVPITLDECEELAKEERIDKWALAARFAHHMLPQVFRPDHPVFEVQFSREHRLKLEGLVEGLPLKVFAATDSLGWVYQFWQTKKKGEVNAAGNKIGAVELPSVTQLFTEDYMVDFLLDNTLGTWHAGKVLSANARLAENARSEDELRQALALPGCPWNYLRFIRSQTPSPPEEEGGSVGGFWAPAAGTFDGWPKTAKELKCLDPCMGSGHFVVAMFERLVALRQAEEKLDEAAAVSAVIRDNLFGLEIDPRCTQLGAFNLALAAWRRVGHRPLPAMNLACSGLAPNAREADWLAIAGDNERLRNGMERLYRLFQKASVLGSLINPRAGEGDLLEATFHELHPLLEKALVQEAKDDNTHEMAVAAHGLAKAAEILAGQFTLVATNVPYLGTKKQDDVLKDYCERIHPDAKTDLATCFIERCLDFCAQGSSTTLVTPHNWLFLGTYKALRKRLLSEMEFYTTARLGPRAFETIGGEVVNVALLILTNERPDQSHSFVGLDVSGQNDASSKAKALRKEGPISVSQKDQSKNPDYRITLENPNSIALLSKVATDHQGLSTGDNPHFRRSFWEIPRLYDPWEVEQSSVENHSHYAGRSGIVMWSTLAKFSTFCRPHRGNEAWGRFGVAIAQMGKLPATLYNGHKFDTNTAVLVPTDQAILPALWCYCSSPQFCVAVRTIDQAIKVTNTTFGKVPFDLARWQKVARDKYPQGLPMPFSSDSTQWLFNGYPAGADQPMQVAVARLLGYLWPRQIGSSFPDCPALKPDSLENLADGDGIVCIPAIRGERPAHERLLQLLHTSWGDEWNDGIFAKLLADTGSSNLDDWLRNGFFEQHCKLFNHRPFIWHIWDGRKRDGFHALVNYHKLAEGGGKGRRLLESLTYSYLGDWIARQQDGVKRGEGGAEDRLAAALELQKRLVAILEGEPPFDLFVRWKPIEEQPIGWEPDINDGVRLNIRPFMAQDLPGGKKGAGILRAKPNIHWKKDRGKEPTRDQEQFPWFWKDGKFTGERVNDVHLTNAEKRAARAQGGG
ncbi:MAG: N-6 DNA methylase [Candidatus Thiodiazotropha sp.]